jgi:hypothetical protein
MARYGTTGNVGHVAHVGEKGNACTLFAGGRGTGKRTLGRATRRWEDNIKMYREDGA